MSKASLKSAYPIEILTERSRVLHELSELDSPVSHGIVIDKEGTASHEQAVQVSKDGNSATLFVVDTSCFAPGGAVDQHGLLGVRSVYNESGSTSKYKHPRLFKDPIIYRRLDVTNPEGCPTVAFSFTQADDGWQLENIERRQFHADSTHDKGESAEIDALSDIEHDLEVALGNHIGSLEAQYGIGFMGDQKGRIWTHRPLREWADFKNLQLLTRLVVDKDPSAVLSKEATDTIRDHLNDRRRIGSIATATEVLKGTAKMEMQLLDIVTLPDPRKYKLSVEAFRLFCSAILEERVDPAKIVGIGSLQGILPPAVEALAHPIEGALTPDWEDYFIAILQSTDRSENDTTARNRSILSELKRRQELLSGDESLALAIRQFGGFVGRRVTGNISATRRR